MSECGVRKSESCIKLPTGYLEGNVHIAWTSQTMLFHLSRVTFYDKPVSRRSKNHSEPLLRHGLTCTMQSYALLQ